MFAKLRQGVDLKIVLLVTMLAAIGVMSLYSASGSDGKLPLYGRQIVWFLLGAVLMILIAKLDYHTLIGYSPYFYTVVLASLCYLLFFGEKRSGMKGWFCFGPVSIQPSEFMKVAVLLLLAYLFSHYRRTHVNLFHFLMAAAVVGVPMILIAKQPDLGTAITFTAIFVSVIYFVGLNRKYIAVLLILLVLSGCVLWFFVLKEYQKKRIMTFFRPETDSRDSGYHIIQSRIAIGNGGLLGKGFCKGTQSKLDFVPEKHTDFIFPVFAEEFGFVGSCLIIGIYLALILRCLKIAEHARDMLGILIVTGFVSYFAFHIFVNLGTVLGLTPTIGIPLPLMSYGGSAMMSTMIGFGLVQSVGSKAFTR